MIKQLMNLAVPATNVFPPTPNYSEMIDNEEVITGRMGPQRECVAVSMTM
jgi:hypothetical protein